MCANDYVEKKKKNTKNNHGNISFFVNAPSARAANALPIDAAVSSIIGFIISNTSRGLALKNDMAASANN